MRGETPCQLLHLLRIQRFLDGIKPHPKLILRLGTAAVAAALASTMVMPVASAEQVTPPDGTGVPVMSNFQFGRHDNGQVFRAWDDGVETYTSAVQPVFESDIPLDADGNPTGLYWDFARDDNGSGDNLYNARFHNSDTGALEYPLFFYTAEYPSWAQNPQYYRYPQPINNLPLTVTSQKPYTGQLSAEDARIVNNVLKLGYGETTREGDANFPWHPGTASYTLGNLDAQLTTQWHPMSTLDKYLNLDTADDVLTHYIEFPDRPYDGRNTEANEVSTALMGIWKDDDLTIKLASQGDLVDEGDSLVAGYKLSVPAPEVTTTGGEHMVFAEADLTLDVDIPGATLRVKPASYSGNFNEFWNGTDEVASESPISTTESVHVKQGDVVELVLPKQSLTDVDADALHLVANGGSPEYQWSIQEATLQGDVEGVDTTATEYFLQLGERHMSTEQAAAEIPLPGRSAVALHYVDEDGTPIADDGAVSGLPGTTWTAPEPKAIDGYEFVRQDATDGVFGEGTAAVTYVYAAIPAPAEPSATEPAATEPGASAGTGGELSQDMAGGLAAAAVAVAGGTALLSRRRKHQA